ncbi:MAG: DUF4296 domain-containing protein [Balneolaceae bacterium]|nr:DUF4296 domain-containing protein [Balneolaceae bacterium]
MRVLSILLLSVLAFLATSCGEREKPENLIPEDTYIDILVEIQLAKSYQKSLPPDSIVYDSLNKKILGRYDVTKEQFEYSHQYYQQQLAEQTKRIDEAIERLRKDMAKGGTDDTTASR